VRRILFGGGLENRASVGRQQIGRQSSWEPVIIGVSSPPAKQVDANERGVPATQAGALLEPKAFGWSRGLGNGSRNKSSKVVRGTTASDQWLLSTGTLRICGSLLSSPLFLAAINQIFSLLDPLIFRHIIDSYATRYREYSSPQFIRGVGLLLPAAVGVALVSRIAKNFQDYFVNVITQKVGARIYTDGVRHSLDLPYTLFEDQRSGETLGSCSGYESDVEKFIALLVNMCSQL